MGEVEAYGRPSTMCRVEIEERFDDCDSDDASDTYEEQLAREEGREALRHLAPCLGKAELETEVDALLEGGWQFTAVSGSEEGDYEVSVRFVSEKLAVVRQRVWLRTVMARAVRPVRCGHNHRRAPRTRRVLKRHAVGGGSAGGSSGDRPRGSDDDPAPVGAPAFAGVAAQ